MIKNILILTYIFIVLGISGFAKASDIVVDQISYDDSFKKLSLSGRSLQDCEPQLQAVVKGTETSGSGLTVVIAVENKNSVKSCQLLNKKENFFDLVLDIRSLGINSNSPFELKVANSSSEEVTPLTIDLMSSNNDHSAQVSSYKGLVILLGSGEYALLTSDRKALVIKSTIDLSKYAGEQVKLSGIEFVHQVGPIVEINAFDPLSADRSESPSMFVLSISTI